MAKKRSKKQTGPAYPGAPAETHKKWRQAAVAVGVLLVLSLVAAHFGLGQQPALVVWLLGLVCAAVAVVVYVLATHEPEHDDLVLRMQRGQHLDFGRRLRTTRKQRRMVKLPLLGPTSLRTLGGVAVFAVVFAWWLTPWAPVAVAERKIEDLSAPLTGELLAVVLVMPDPHLATAQVPIISPRARQLAEEVPEDATPYERAQKAIAQERFADARGLLESALGGGQTDAADVHVALGEAELYAYRFDEAIKAFNEALKLKPEDPTVLCLAAVAAMHASRYEDAERLAGRAMKALQQKPKRTPQGRRADQAGEDDAVRAAVLHLRAVLYTIRACDPKELDEAEQLFDQAKTIQQKDEVLGRQHAYVAATVNNQAVLYQLRAKYQGVEVLYREARNTWRHALGEKHPHVAASLGNLAMFYCVRSAFEDARECNAEAQAIRGDRDVLPKEHPIRAVGLNTTSILERTYADYDAAGKPAEDALMIFETVLGPEHPDIAACASELGSFYVERAQYLTIALPYFLRAQSVTADTLGPEHPYLAVTLNKLANLYRAQHQYPQAQETAERALGIARKVYGEEHPVVAAILNTLGRLEIEQDRPPQARPHLEKALDIEEKMLGKQNLLVAVTLGNLAALDNGPYDYSRGVKRYRRAIAMTEKIFHRGDPEHPEHPAVARLLVDLAALYVHRSRYDEAAKCLGRALQIQEKVVVPFQPYHPEVADTLEAYAAVLRKLSPPQADRAKKMEARAEGIRARHSEEDRPKTASP